MPHPALRARHDRAGAALALAALVAGAALAPMSASATRDGSVVVERLERADAALARQADRVAARLDAERGALAFSRARLDGARTAHRDAVAALQVRIRAVHRQAGTLSVGDVLVGGPDEAQGRLELIERLAHADRTTLARYRASVGELDAAGRDVAARKEALAGLQRELAVRRVVVRSRLGRARASLARQEAAARAASAPPPAPLTLGLPASAAYGLPLGYTPAPSAAPGERGLPPAVLAARSLPGAVAIDPVSGRPTILATGPGTPATPVAFPLPAGGVGLTTMVASWYGPGFERKDTANGEPFDPSALTAAHRTLPFGTWLRVGLAGRLVTVRVNDRGPYVEGRDLDLSQAAAESLGLGGVAAVSVEVIPAP